MRSSSPAAILACAALATGMAVAQDAEQVQITTVPVAKGVFMLVGSGGNIGVSAGDDGVLLIDDQFAPLTDKIRAAASAISPKPIRFLINTHWHADHTGGNENLGNAGVLIVAQDEVRKRMSVEQFSKVFDRRIPPSPTAALPVVTYTDAVTLHLNGDEIRAFHVPPAHTDGDSVVHFVKADVLHMGDVYFNGLYPFIDVESRGSIDGMISAAERGLTLAGPSTKIIPGHGPLSDRKGLQAYRDMLVAVRDRVAALIREGKTRDEIIAAKPSAAFDETWGKGFLSPDRFVGIVCASMGK
jgi:cyclase